MIHRFLGYGSAFPHAYRQGRRRQSLRLASVSSFFSDELCLKLLIAALFLPEGLSFFIGDFRLTVARVLLIVFFIAAASRLARRGTSRLVWVPSDVMALAAGIWMMLAGVVTDGWMGLKGASILAIEFTGAYYAFRYLLGPVDSSVRVIKFGCKLLILAVIVALLDPLSGKLFTYEFVKGITGYVIPSLEGLVAAQDQTVFRHGLVRAMGPFDHSILFGTVCVWFGSLALITFPSRLFGWAIAGVALLGVWFSSARGPLLAYFIACALVLFYTATKRLPARWKVLGLLGAAGITFIFSFANSPIAALVRLSGVDARTGWYRQAIWEAVVPLVAQSPLFGIGFNANWNWQAVPILSSASVDAFWLKAAMDFGIPGALLIFLTMAAAFWLGPIDRSRHLSHEEKRLSVALGIAITAACFLGFTVHFWGTCWILLGVFPGIRANLAEAAILRRRAARATEVLDGKG